MSSRHHPLLQSFVFFFLSLGLPVSACAGHGFASAFGNIEWLPEPGRTPDSTFYRLDMIREESQLFLAHTPKDKLTLCLIFAREKLAELEAMVKTENVAAAKIAAEYYQHYIDRATELIAEDAPDKEALTETLAAALLEHQYILSVIYEELPVSTRAIVPLTITAAKERYDEVAARLSPKKRGAFFFKEEEVRWSVEMAKRLDEEQTP
ncbi:MAG: DUF5667 domain-containing protein [Candidatus Binatia bacterium]